MTVGTMCSRVVATAAPGEKVRIAARRMAVNDVGTLVVVEGNAYNEAVGIVTDRDIAMRCVAGNLDPDTAPLSQVMTQPVATIDESMGVDAALAKMAANGTRRLIVTGSGHLVGILSLDDVLELLVSQVAAIGELLQQQQPRIPA